MGEMRNAYKILVRKPEVERPLGKPRRIWEYNAKMCIRETWWEVVVWIRVVQDRDQWRAVVNTVLGSIKDGEF
jgi:hypothetical protein